MVTTRREQARTRHEHARLQRSPPHSRILRARPVPASMPPRSPQRKRSAHAAAHARAMKESTNVPIAEAVAKVDASLFDASTIDVPLSSCLEKSARLEMDFVDVCCENMQGSIEILHILAKLHDIPFVDGPPPPPLGYYRAAKILLHLSDQEKAAARINPATFGNQVRQWANAAAAPSAFLQWFNSQCS